MTLHRLRRRWTAALCLSGCASLLFAQVETIRTDVRPDGNRVVPGHGPIHTLRPRDIPLRALPAWVVGTSQGSGILWSASLADGRVQAFWVNGDRIEERQLQPAALPPGAPPFLVSEGGKSRLLEPPSDASSTTHPVLLGSSENMAYITEAGFLVIVRDGIRTALDVRALPDARILADDQQRLLFLSHPATHYGHGVLGDAIEAESLTLVELRPAPRVLRRIDVTAPDVIEGIAPIWTDWNGDGRRDIIVTQANASSGARIVVYDEEGMIQAAGPPVGQGFRWRHQLAVAPFGPAGELELADVLTPHIGGVVEFYRWERGALEIVATLRGFTSHAIRSRNLDLALAGDFSGTGQSVLLVPNQARTHLGAVRHGPEGVEVQWSLEIGASLSSNVSAVRMADDRLAVAVGRNDAVLRVWQPSPLPAALEAWFQSHELSGSQASLTADPDGDGVNNLGEFAFNLNPQLPDARLLPNEATRAGLPVIRLAGTGTSARLQIEFFRRRTAAEIGLAYRAEFAGAFPGAASAAWLEAKAPERVLSRDGDWERVQVDDSVTVGEAAQRYGRIQVTLTR